MTQSQRRSAPYDSRKAPGAKGIGYPSANTELDRLPPNTKDPHGYYVELGVDPGIGAGDLKRRVRLLLRQLHPDTGSGDAKRFQLIRNIGKVLLDPIAREKYNRTPKGMRLMDAVYEAELSKIDEFQGLTAEELARVFVPQAAPKNPYATSLGTRYDYFALDPQQDKWRSDGLKAQLWYHFLMDSAKMVNYRRVIKVVITSGDAEYHHEVSMFFIPRAWEPSSALAHSLMTHVAGFRPGQNDPQTRLGFVRPTLSD